jgi:hypothetical protein
MHSRFRSDVILFYIRTNRDIIQIFIPSKGGSKSPPRYWRGVFTADTRIFALLLHYNSLISETMELSINFAKLYDNYHTHLGNPAVDH